MKNTFYKTFGLSTLLVAGISSACGRDEAPKETTLSAPQPSPAPVQDFIRTYVVQRGDIPSVWIYNTLKLRGNAIYEKVKVQ